MLTVAAWLIAIPLLGFLTGCRTMTPMAVLCWFAYEGRMGLSGAVMRGAAGSGSVEHGTGVHGTWAFWTARLVTVIIFTVLAVGELIGDKLPKTPNRTDIFPLLARVFFGGLVGAAAATGMHGSAVEGALLGAAGAVAGTFIGFHLRQMLVKEKGMSDMTVALFEDVLVIGLSVMAMGIVTG